MDSYWSVILGLSIEDPIFDVYFLAMSMRYHVKTWFLTIESGRTFGRKKKES